MSLKLYTIFHLNLMYSSIEESSRKEVIDKCYWPLFKLVDYGIPIGIEAPSVTLEIINKLDFDWILQLKKYIQDGKIEFVGSGYSQIIGPLVPASINDWNQKLGLETYKKLLNVKPNIALVNEMAYSSGIIEHYINNNYKGLIMEWNNPRSTHKKWKNEWRYNPQKVVDSNGNSIKLIWADSIAFQKFQRYTHSNYALKDYEEYLKYQIGDQNRYFPIYSNDVEIFDYRPGRYKTEDKINQHSEWARIFNLYTHLSKKNWCKFVFPSKLMEFNSSENTNNKIDLESPAYPIPVKKQEKYNINRWALTGRDDFNINTRCYKIYNMLVSKGIENSSIWRELCYLWSSDFRTHITDKRWKNFLKRLSKVEKKHISKNLANKNILLNGKFDFTNDDKNNLIVENNKYKLLLNKNKGLTINKFYSKDIDSNFLFGSLDHGYYDDISLGADYFSGHCIIERFGEHKVTDLNFVDPEIIDKDNQIIINSKQILNDFNFSNKIIIQNDKIIIKKNINSNIEEKLIIHPYNFTINPKAWNQESLFLEIKNGGYKTEKFILKGSDISHGDIFSSLISARHGFGNTDGKLIVGDINKKIIFSCDMSESALIPSIIYKEIDDTFFFRIQYSARELDETMKNYKTKNLKTKIEINYFT